jgi:hypothetical protein
MKSTPNERKRARRWPSPSGAPATNGRAPKSDDPAVAKEALKDFVRSLARAAAIEDYGRRQGHPEADHESGHLRSV